MFTEPKRGNGYNESELSYATKRLWAIVNYYELYEKITFEYFIKNIQEFIEKYEFDWPEPKPGKDKYPKYDTAKEWPSKYDYDSCVQCFENYQLNYDKEKADKIHEKRYFKDTLSDFKNYDAYEEQIQKELSKDNPNPSEIEKWEHLKEKSMNRNDRRSGRDVKKIEANINSNINADVGIATNETEEERLNRYANYFKRINNKATSIPSNNNTR